MNPLRTWLPLYLALLSGSASAAAEIAVVTLVDTDARVLRGATWYKLAPGAWVEEADIIEAGERAQVQLEFGSGTTANFVGAGSLYLPPTPVKAGAPAGPLNLSLPRGWLKVVANAPGVRVRAPPADVATADGVIVVRAQGPALDLFVEAGGVRLTDVLASGIDGPARDAKRGEHWTKPAAGAFAMVPRAPAAFVDAMPRHYFDPLPNLAGKFKVKPVLTVERDITYAEAEPWLAGRDRAVFERRFTSRLRDPAFRKAVEPHIARYPVWDRMLHPEKYEPKPAPAKQSSGRAPETAKHMEGTS